MFTQLPGGSGARGSLRTTGRAGELDRGVEVCEMWGASGGLLEMNGSTWTLKDEGELASEAEERRGRGGAAGTQACRACLGILSSGPVTRMLWAI